MKTLYLLFALFGITLNSFTQENNWRPIRNDDTYFYFGNNEYRAYKIDSVGEYADSITMFSYNEVFASALADCINPNGPSWIGRKIVNYKDSTRIYNFNNEAITFLQEPKIGNTWCFYKYDNKNVINARITDKRFEDIGYVEDSIIIIELESNNNFNTKELKISKNHGMISGYNFLHFPELKTEFSQLDTFLITGQISNTSSKANLTAHEIYNYEIGDEIHTHERYITWPEGTVYTDEKIIRNVVSKQYNNDSTEITYEFNQCDKSGRKQTTYTYDLSSTNLSDLPFEPKIIEEVSYKTLNLNQMGKHSNEFRFKDFGGEYRYRNDSCYAYICVDKKSSKIIKSIPFVMQSGMYIEGLGGPYYDRGLMFVMDSRSLIYYKKGDKEWGTPFSCDDIIISSLNKLAETIEVYPNPASNYITIEIDELTDNLEIAFYTMQGKKLYVNCLNTGKNIIPISSFPIGAIVYEIKNQKGEKTKGVFVKE